MRDSLYLLLAARQGIRAARGRDGRVRRDEHRPGRAASGASRAGPRGAWQMLRSVLPRR